MSNTVNNAASQDLCTAGGCPVAVEVFEGNTSDPATLTEQISKLKQRLGLKRVVLVGDRGVITSARIAEDLMPAELDWITALRAPAIQKLAAENGPWQLSLFDDRDLGEIESPDYPGERLIVCRNPALGAERARKRNEPLAGTEHELERIQARVRRARQPLRGAHKIGQAVGAVLGRRKVAKHFRITITDDTVRAYKSLARVERAFRSLKTIDLDLRPVFHWTAPRVRAHVLLCMLAYYLEWHMRQALAPMLFDDHDPAAGEALRASPVAKAQPSPAARRKAKTKRTDDGLPVHSIRSLLADLATLTRNHRPLRPRRHLPRARNPHTDPAPRPRPARRRSDPVDRTRNKMRVMSAPCSINRESSG
jgi:hypothetical protein